MSLYEDYGSHEVPGPYEGAINRDCPECGAEAGMRCTFQAKRMVGRKPETVTLTRHMPCLRRLSAEDVE